MQPELSSSALAFDKQDYISKEWVKKNDAKRVILNEKDNLVGLLPVLYLRVPPCLPPNGGPGLDRALREAAEGERLTFQCRISPARLTSIKAPPGKGHGSIISGDCQTGPGGSH